jgi:hypothetical protein
VVPFRLGQQRDLRDQAERGAEALKLELPGQAPGPALPARDLARKLGDLRLWERWRPRGVLLAVLVDKLGNGRTVLVKRRGEGASRGPLGAWRWGGVGRYSTAFALIATNSTSVMAPLSSSCLAFSISAAAPSVDRATERR